MNELTIKLKTGDEIKGVLTRSFKYQDTDLEVLTEGSKETLVFSLDEICYIRFQSPPAGIGRGGNETLEEVQTIAGETFQVTVPGNGKFLKGFLGLLPGDDNQTIFFTDSGVRYRQDARYTGQILHDQGVLSNEKLEAALKLQEEQAQRGDQDAAILLADAVDEGEMHEQAQRHEMHHTRVGDILVESGLVTREQVEAAFKSQKGKKLQVGELLIMKGLITEEQLLSALATKFRLRFVDLETVVPTDAALSAISEGLATRLRVFPISLDGRKLVVATCAPTDLTIGDNLRFSTNFAPELVVAPSRQILAAIDKYYRNRVETVDTLLNAMKGEAETVTIEEEADDTRLLFEPDSKIISLVNRILIDAYRRGASDIHFEPGAGSEPLSIRYRIDGECIHAHKVAASYKGAITVRIKIMADLNIAERRRPQSGKILLRYRQQMLEYRVEITPMVGGREGAVLRLLAASKPLPLSGLGLLPHNLERFIDILEKPHGIILCVGPTGSGKTTTLHSALGHINTQERKIWTAEDPVEITQAGLCQVQVNAKIGFTFAEALRSFLRADPDVIMIGEMRDAETSKIAIEASLTGHLVFSTLHTNSAPEAAVRLIEMGMDPFNFSDALLGILAQRLAKRLCPKCKKPARDQRQRYDDALASLRQIAGDNIELLADFKDANFMKAVGCDECGGTGYKGRLALHELMVGTETVKSAIRRGVGMDELRSIAMDEGMWTLKMDGLMKVLQGETDLEQILKVCM
ncbi:Flp pilus assembly complex ATPase component TadA [Geomonas sp. Red69]|uniref:Flp pilus assembly complex ATPase component TadA n=1 Tax=Geomonas diazotrophica TaxID=2843197 RepID=A0ABX8JJY9_9BACT|nr:MULTISPECIES: ATPase, T2SS/T4P/T4SS family [Geomonas]MBU5635465.1 Flp pilus assembly complex ATPase component TadA [Geomonas diazotrophica]QWV97486.1 Flp pilus assembly complex ATPase component TadA [Geomonas nitrogeniifigens]QXE86625.1 Flp pilus assembly complex ATPase component TadA [Geomonas nitrogeniifigens]